MSTYPHDEDEGPAGEEDEVAYEEAGDPDDGEADIDELEALRRPRQEVPALKKERRQFKLRTLSQHSTACSSSNNFSRNTIHTLSSSATNRCVTSSSMTEAIPVLM